MSPQDALAEAGQPAHQNAGAVANDFSIQVATVNGSGSQTANLVLLRSIFQMGIPVSGKNLFPSNIAGLPTWYTIRANKHGYIGRKKEIDFLVAMNPETAREDVLSLEPGASCVYDEPLQLKALRTDITFFPVPFDKLVADVTTDAKLRRLVRNMIYDGILSFLLDIELDEMKKALAKQLGKKPKAMALNSAALDKGFAYAEATFAKAAVKVERMNKTAGKVLIEGNAAAALGCLFAGVTVVAWYPITPSSSLCETLIDYLRKYRIDKETGKASFAVVQAEDEIAALGMVVGASWAGARSMTSTAGPGISLMAEFTGLAYYAELPAVIFDIQRVGPSTGLPTRTAQQDIAFAAGLSHGDCRHVLLLPSSVAECYEMAQDAFDLAERLQTPVFVMSDLDLGMNTWMSDPFEYPDQAARSRQGARRRDAGAHRRLGPLQGRRRRRHSLPDAARHRHAGLLHARHRPQREGALQRAAGRLRPQPRSPDAQVRHGARARARAGRRTGPAPRSASSPTARRTGRSRRAAISWCAKPGSRPTTSACAPIRSTTRSARSSTPTIASTSSSRTATRRCSACCGRS